MYAQESDFINGLRAITKGTVPLNLGSYVEAAFKTLSNDKSYSQNLSAIQNEQYNWYRDNPELAAALEGGSALLNAVFGGPLGLLSTAYNLYTNPAFSDIDPVTAGVIYSKTPADYLLPDYMVYARDWQDDNYQMAWDLGLEQSFDPRINYINYNYNGVWESSPENTWGSGFQKYLPSLYAALSDYGNASEGIYHLNNALDLSAANAWFNSTLNNGSLWATQGSGPTIGLNAFDFYNTSPDMWYKEGGIVDLYHQESPYYKRGL